MAAASITPVSHASILTGQYPYHHGLRVLHGLYEYRLPDAARTLAEVLGAAGYRTAAFVSAFPAGSRFGLDQGFETFDEDFLEASASDVVTSEGTVVTGLNQRRAAETTDLALDWLEESDEPFFLWLHYFDPHDPALLPPEAYLRRHPVPRGTQQEVYRALYDVEIRYMDEQIGRVIDRLAESGRLDDTLVVVVSDHGEGLGDHTWWGHGILYREQIQVVLVVAAPHMPAGRRVRHLVRTVDVMPTVLELADVDRPDLPAMDGESLVAMLAADTPDPGYTAYADAVNTLAPYGRDFLSLSGRREDMLFTLLDGEWKLIHHLKHPEDSELYHVSSDPRESENLLASRPEEAARLLGELRARDFLPDLREGPGLSREDLRRLKELGYVE
jgi:arylsulfatase A-like enzyme